MVNIKELLCFVVLVISSAIAQQEGDGCIFARTATVGTCVKIESCRAAIANIRRGIGPQFCGFSDTGPTIVCCDSGVPPNTVTTTTTLASLGRPPSEAPPNTATTTTTLAPPGRSPSEVLPSTTTTSKTTTTNLVSLPSEDGCPPLPAKTGQKSWDYCIDVANTLYRCNNSLSLGGPREREGLCSNYVDGHRERRNTRSRRVAGGVPAGLNEFPHLALLGFSDAVDITEWRCGGTLIHKRWVLTTVYCTRIHPTKGNLKLVLLGSPNIGAPIDKKMLFDITHIVQNPDSTTYDSIALLKIDRDATFGPAVIPACLHVDPTVNINKAVLAGWGTTSVNGPRSNVLLKVELEEIPHAQCSAFYLTVNLTIYNDAYVCYGSRTEGKGTCQSDYGSPIQIQNKNVYCTYTIVGVSTIPFGCGTKSIPDLYLRIAAYVPWIESVVWP